MGVTFWQVPVLCGAQMRVVGLDQSYTGFGYCVDGDAKKKAFPASKYPNPVDRLFAVEDWLHDWLVGLGPVDLVTMEGYANAMKFGREAAGELGWAVKRKIYVATNTYPLIVPPSSLKRFVTGKGNSKKNEMLLGVYKKWGAEFSDDNQADAFALEKFGYAYLALVLGRPRPRGQEVSYPQYQVEAVEAVRKAK